MTNIKSAADVMLQNATKNLKAGGVWSDQIIGRTRLSPSNDYSYCPYCVQRAKRGNENNWKQGMQPLWRITHYMVIETGNNKGRGLLDKRFFCDVCRKEITEEDYLECRPVRQNIEVEIDLTKIPRGAPIVYG